MRELQPPGLAWKTDKLSQSETFSTVTDIADTEPKVRVQDPVGSQTLMKPNA
jgi:hypothetical protein